jgi:hypothetical protein
MMLDLNNPMQHSIKNQAVELVTNLLVSNKHADSV